ncbi:MAG: phage tail assembly chaperone [Caulobacterales bacterium]|nr:phage tail assembly chaperone [Caulobacterales bacterium]
MTTPWPDLLRLAALRFQIPPEAFWRLSLAEWRALTAEGAAPALDRTGFEALTGRYPD